MENTDTAVNYVIYLDSFALSLKVEGLRPHTISCYVRDAYRLGERSGWITPSKLTATHVRRLITASEPSRKKALDESVVKQMTGGDTLTARFLNKEFFEFTPSHTIVMATNDLPQVSGVDQGIWRRLVVVQFPVNITDQERDNKLLDKLQKEKSGILNRLVQGCLDWQKSGLEMPASVTQASADYRAEADSVWAFVQDACEQIPGSYVVVSDLRTAYDAWCKIHGKTPAVKFPSRLEVLGFESGRITGGTRVRYGLKLK